MDSKRKEFDPDDLLLEISKNSNKNTKENELNNDLKAIADYEDFGLPELTDHKASPEVKNKINNKSQKGESNEQKQNELNENKDYYDTKYWENPYTNNFKIEDLLME